MARTRMTPYEIFVGTWNTRGRVLATDDAPETILTATDSYRWLPGRHFILHEVDARFGDEPTRSMEIMGFDPARGRFFAQSYDDRGGSQRFDVALRRRRWTITGESVRFDGRFDATGDRLSGLWELKAHRGRWQPWIELELARA